jgi:hypothetical protein
MSLDTLDNRNTSQPAEPPRPRTDSAVYIIFRTPLVRKLDAKCLPAAQWWW